LVQLGIFFQPKKERRKIERERGKMKKIAKKEEDVNDLYTIERCPQLCDRACCP
jgi:hypothetical protein